MPSWFTIAFPSDAELQWQTILVRLLAALVVGGVVAAIYRGTRRRHAGGADLSQTLLLLSVVIAMITLAIGDNAARAFSLVGALAIVRFRSVVEDPRDTAFVILAGGVALAFSNADSLGSTAASHCRVLVRTEPSCSQAAVRMVLHQHLDRCRPRRLEMVKKSTLVEQAWSGRLKPDSDGPSLIQALRDTPGVVGVELVFAD